MKSKAAHKRLHKAASNGVLGGRIESTEPKNHMQMMMKKRVMTKENN